MIKNIVFDMGNVLIRYDAYQYVEKYCKGEKKDKDLLYQEVFQSVEWIQTDRGILSDEAAVRSICKRLPEKLHSIVEELFFHWHDEIPPFPEMEQLIKELKENNYNIYLLSNTCKNYHSFKKKIPAIRYMDGEFISADWRLLKPDERIYHAFCQHFRLVPTECYFIDDAPANIEGAKYIGMDGFIYHGDIKQLKKGLKDAGVNISF